MRKVCAILAATLLCLVGPNNSPAQSEPAIPELARWENNMLTHGTRLCEYLKAHPQGYSDPHLAATYYDAQWVMFQIGDYTRNYSYWNSCAQAAEFVYRDTYAMPNDGRVPGYWNFTHGLTQDYLRTGDAASKNAAISLSRNAGYAYDGTSLSQTVGAALSREVSYAITGYLNEELLGQPRRSRLTPMVDQALSHIDQWVISRTAPYVRPFMVSLTAHALTSWHEVSGDSRVLPALKAAADYIWDTCWMPEAQAFSYTDRSIGNADDLLPAADLSLLIAPMYAWLYHHTGDMKYRDRGDQIFAGGVINGYVSGNKQFNQSYRLSFEFVRLRKLPPQAGNSATPTATPTASRTPTPTPTPSRTATGTPSATPSFTPTRAATTPPTKTPVATATPVPASTVAPTPPAANTPGGNDKPDEPAGTCGYGIADADADGDGALDCRDLCVHDAGKTIPGVCGCGAADIDANANGITDCLSKDELKFSLSRLQALLPKVEAPKSESEKRALRETLANIRAVLSDIQIIVADGADRIQVRGGAGREMESLALRLTRSVKAALKVRSKQFIANKKRAVRHVKMVKGLLA